MSLADVDGIEFRDLKRARLGAERRTDSGESREEQDPVSVS